MTKTLPISPKNAEDPSDAELVRRSLAHPDAFRFVVERYWERLFRYARRISFSTDEDIEDILQETFLKVYRNLNDYDDRLTFSTWIYHICRNTVIDAIRKKSSRPEIAPIDTEDMLHLFKDDTDIIRTLDTKEQLKKITALIKSLPLLYREVLILKFLEERTYEEIMDIIEKPKGTIASLINRGRKILLEKVREEKIFLPTSL